MFNLKLKSAESQKIMASLVRNFSLFRSISRSFSTGKYLNAAQVQQPAPDFKGQAVVNGQFKEISLSDFHGKWLILFFYPLDFAHDYHDLCNLEV